MAEVLNLSEKIRLILSNMFILWHCPHITVLSKSTFPDNILKKLTNFKWWWVLNSHDKLLYSKFYLLAYPLILSKLFFSLFSSTVCNSSYLTIKYQFVLAYKCRWAHLAIAKLMQFLRYTHKILPSLICKYNY